MCSKTEKESSYLTIDFLIQVKNRLANFRVRFINKRFNFQNFGTVVCFFSSVLLIIGKLHKYMYYRAKMKIHTLYVNQTWIIQV